jgi:hypothetical protein
MLNQAIPKALRLLLALVGNSDFGFRFLGLPESGIPLPKTEFRNFPAEKTRKFMAGIGSVIVKKKKKGGNLFFRSESETKSEKSTQKNDRNPEFRGIPAEFRRNSQPSTWSASQIHVISI